MHDSSVFRESSLGIKIWEDPSGLFPVPDSFLVGDLGYPLHENLMIPIKKKNLSEEENRFNFTLRSSRSIVERFYGQLKARFRRLNNLNCSSLEQSSRIVTVCCILSTIIDKIETEK